MRMWGFLSGGTRKNTGGGIVKLLQVVTTKPKPGKSTRLVVTFCARPELLYCFSLHTPGVGQAYTNFSLAVRSTLVALKPEIGASDAPKLLAAAGGHVYHLRQFVLRAVRRPPVSLNATRGWVEGTTAVRVGVRKGPWAFPVYPLRAYSSSSWLPFVTATPLQRLQQTSYEVRPFQCCAFVYSIPHTTSHIVNFTNNHTGEVPAAFLSGP